MVLNVHSNHKAYSGRGERGKEVGGGGSCLFSRPDITVMVDWAHIQKFRVFPCQSM